MKLFKKRYIRFDDKCERTLWIGDRKFILPMLEHVRSIYFYESLICASDVDETWDLAFGYIFVTPCGYCPCTRAFGKLEMYFNKDGKKQRQASVDIEASVEPSADRSRRNMWHVVKELNEVRLEDLEVKDEKRAFRWLPWKRILECCSRIWKTRLLSQGK